MNSVFAGPSFSIFAAKGDSNHWVMMDAPESVGGLNAGSRPNDLVLFALAGCTASDVVGILRKKRTPLQGFEMHLTGQEAEEHPKVFTEIHVEYVFFGDDIRNESQILYIAPPRFSRERGRSLLATESNRSSSLRVRP